VLVAFFYILTLWCINTRLY